MSKKVVYSMTKADAITVLETTLGKLGMKAKVQGEKETRFEAVVHSPTGFPLITFEVTCDDGELIVSSYMGEFPLNQTK